MRRIWLIFSQAVTVALAAFFVVATLKPQWLSDRGSAPAALSPPSVTAPAQGPASGSSSAAASASDHGSQAAPAPATSSLALAARRAAPAVVSIAASKMPMRNAQMEDPWFRFFFGDRARQAERSQVGLGSGVIVSNQGFILTNNHVIEGADDIEVQLIDGRAANARLIGTDPESDIAVLKIDLEQPPTITFGRVDALQVGDTVLAIGNPFGVGQTVTSGIVSALGRNRLGINTFENFIQTDAAINPGNSGGALVDAEGRLVGINTAIYSRSGGSLGIGFAIPADAAQRIMDNLVRDGSVTRGWIGVEPRDLTPEIAASLRVPVAQGVLITGVLQNGPAARGGIQPGDVVLRIGTQPVSSTRELLDTVASLKPGQPVNVTVQRGPRSAELQVMVAQRQRVQRAAR